jgi:hypothetical protein
LTILPPSCADCHEIWDFKLPGILRACPGLYWGGYTSNNSVTKCNVAGTGLRGACGLYAIAIAIAYSPVCEDPNAPQCCVVCEFLILL